MTNYTIGFQMLKDPHFIMMYYPLYIQLDLIFFDFT